MSVVSVYTGPHFGGKRQEEKGGAEYTEGEIAIQLGGGGVSGGRAGVKWH